MAIYRRRLTTNTYQAQFPFYGPPQVRPMNFGDFNLDAAQGLGVDLNALAAGGYATDWPGVVGTAQHLGIDAMSLINGAAPLAPGAGVTAPNTAPALLAASPVMAPPVVSTPWWMLAAGAAAVYFLVLKG